MSNLVSNSGIPRSIPPTAADQTVLTAAKGGGITFVGTLFEYTVRLVLGIILARLLGVEQYGLYSLALTAGIVAGGLALLGMPSALVRFVSLYRSQRDPARLWGMLQVGVGLPAVLGVLLGLGLYVGAPFFAQKLFQEPKLVDVLRIISFAIPFLTLNDTIAAATRGFSKMQYSVIATNIFQPIIKLILVILLAITGLTATKAVAAQIPVLILASLLLLFFLNGLFSIKRSINSAHRETKQILKFSLPLYLTYLINTFRGNIQTILLGALNTISTVGIFTVASQINQVGRMFHQSIVISSMPIVSELYGQGQREALARLYQTMTKWTFTLNLPMFLTVLLFPVPILSIFGKGFTDGAAAVIILAWGNLVDAGTGICGVILDMTGKTTLSLLNSTILSILTIGLNILLIPKWGLVGAATATLTAVVLVNILRLLEVFILFKILPYNLSFLKPILAGTVASIVAWTLREWFHTEINLIYTIVNVTILFVVYIGIILLLGLSTEDRMVLSRIGQRLNTLLGR